MKRIIFHVDVNSAFLSWEAVYRLYHLGGKLDLRTVPSAVGGSQEHRHGIILAKSIPAKAYQVQTGEPITDAKKKCPNLIIVPPNYDLYNRSSKALLSLLGRYSERIEQYSIDEAFLDMSGYNGDPEETAAEIKDAVKNELGFTVNIGVAENRLLAKMASDFKKPDRVHTLWPWEIPQKMWPLPVRDLFFVGRASERKLKELGIRTIGELARADGHLLYAALKSHGLLIQRYANGIDGEDLTVAPPPNKGYGNSLTTPKDVTDARTAKLFLLSLAENISARLRADHAKISVVSVSLRDCNLHTCGHQMQLSSPTDLTVEIALAAGRLFDELWDGIPLRQLGIHTAKASYDGIRQLGMFDPVDYEKQRRAETAVDALRKKFGTDCIMRACFLPPGEKNSGIWIDHMGGGVSREKRSVDYSREEIL